MNFPWQKKGPVVGLDWGYKSWKWMVLDTSEPRAVVFCESLSLPDKEEERLEFLRQYVVEKGLAASPVSAVFHDEGLTLRRMELPRMPAEDLTEAIRWQMRDIAEESLENYSIRHVVLGEKAVGDIVRLTLLGFAIKTETIQKKRLFLESVGLKPFCLEPVIVAMAAAVEGVYPYEENGWIACADLGLRFPYCLVLGDGHLHFVHSLTGLTGVGMEDPEYPSKLSVELQHALDAFFLSHPNERIEKILLAGGGGRIPRLSQTVSQNIAIPAEIFNPLPMEGPGLKDPFLFGPALAAARRQS